MGSQPFNLVFRFLLELTAVLAYGYWGWQLGDGWSRVALAVLVPLAGAAIWGVFAVPENPSRSGNAPVPIPGFFRLLLEVGFFSLAAWALYHNLQPGVGMIYGLLVCLHYLLAYDRIAWLLGSKDELS